MDFNYELSIAIDNCLREMGYFRQLTARDARFTIFNRREIALITNLELRNISDIEGIDNLFNLKRLVIKGINYSRIKDVDALEMNPLINHIKDFTPIEKTTSLEYLTINNDINLKKLDITNLKKLKKLHLNDDPELIELKGLDKLNNLSDVLIYGTNIKNDINIDRYIANTLSNRNNVLDIKIILNQLKSNPKVLKLINDSKRRGLTHIDVAETNGFINYTKIDTRDLEEMINKLNRRLSHLNGVKDIEKILSIYRNITFNYNFADEKLNERQLVYTEVLKKEKAIPEHMHKYFASLHSSYNLFHFKEGNCEGHVNLMSIMLSLVGIESHIVHCRDKRFTFYTGDTNHAMLRVKFGKKWYYCDPTFDKSNPTKYFMKNQNDLKDTHEISGYEQKVMEGERYENNNRKIFR